jgi:DUF177 domain-containing protein
MNEFTLDVDRLTVDPERHVVELSARWWADRDASTRSEFYDVEAPFRFEIEAVRVGDEIRFEGDLKGEVGLECSRCAKRYSHALRDSFRLVLTPVKDRRTSEPRRAGSGADDPEGERGLAENGLCLGEDLEAGAYRGPVLRLDDFFSEVIALAMPLQPLCRSDCPGICPHCGVDLAETQCDCVDEKIDSPFAVLAKLKGAAD